MTSSILCSWHAADPYRHPLCDTGMLQFCISHEEAHSLHCPDDKRQRHIVTSQSQSVRSLNKRTLFCAGEADVGSDFSLLRQTCAPDSTQLIRLHKYVFTSYHFLPPFFSSVLSVIESHLCIWRSMRSAVRLMLLETFSTMSWPAVGDTLPQEAHSVKYIFFLAELPRH